MSVGVDSEIENGTARCSSTYSGLDVQPLLDRIITLTGKIISLKRDETKKDRLIVELEAKLRATDAGTAFTAAAALCTLAAGSVSNTDLEFLRTSGKSAESAA